MDFRPPLLATCLLAGLSTAAHAQAPTLETVLARAAAYVDTFHRQLSGIVAEETYVQQVIPGERRELKSDLLLVRPAGFDRWLQFRDIFEINGEPVRDRQERLTGLFLQPAETALQQARRIALESARENLGDLIRTINVPVMPLIVLDTANQKRFRFSRQRRDEEKISDNRTDLPVTPTFRVQTEVWVVHFVERTQPTIIRDPVNNRDVPSSGRFWIEPSSGRVLISEMTADQQTVEAKIIVSYQSEPVLGLLVPVEMRETYTNRFARSLPTRRWVRIEATAAYGRFRQFQVSDTQQFHPLREDDEN